LLFFFFQNFELFLSLKLFHFLNQNLSFSFLLLSGFKSIELSVFYLINNNLFSFQGLYFFGLLNFLLFFNFFKSLDFHDFVFFLLLNFEVFPLSLFLLQLSLSDCGGLSIGNHFVHLFDIVHFLLRYFDCLFVNTFSFLSMFFFEFIKR
jgi:hypothetical protein